MLKHVISSDLLVIAIWIFIILFINSTVDGHSLCFLIWATLHSNVRHIHIHVFVGNHVFFPPGQMTPKSGNTGLYGNLIFNF